MDLLLPLIRISMLQVRLRPWVTILVTFRLMILEIIWQHAITQVAQLLFISLSTIYQPRFILLLCTKAIAITQIGRQVLIATVQSSHKTAKTYLQLILEPTYFITMILIHKRQFGANRSQLKLWTPVQGRQLEESQAANYFIFHANLITQ